ncbi:MAG: helix-turn-helix transcriptional regulator [Bacillota bacterium]|nr:helix-turn-helix transcriptional regulator [Bacillota bacterium]
MKLLELLKTTCPYDEAVAFFLDVNRKISGQYTVNINKKWLDMYLNYYLHMMDNASPSFSVVQDLDETSKTSFSRIIDWAKYPRTEFINDYINERGLKYSWGFCFFDLNKAYRVVISLDRVHKNPFSDAERAGLELALPVLNNMHRNFFYQGMDTEDNLIQSPLSQYNLTTRETEIANLLCQGMTVRNISDILFIAVTTTYKHIQHIYEKCDVSSQQELLVKVLNKKNI